MSRTAPLQLVRRPPDQKALGPGSRMARRVATTSRLVSSYALHEEIRSPRAQGELALLSDTGRRHRRSPVGSVSIGCGSSVGSGVGSGEGSAATGWARERSAACPRCFSRSDAGPGDGSAAAPRRSVDARDGPAKVRRVVNVMLRTGRPRRHQRPHGWSRGARSTRATEHSVAKASAAGEEPRARAALSKRVFGRDRLRPSRRDRGTSSLQGACPCDVAPLIVAVGPNMPKLMSRQPAGRVVASVSFKRVRYGAEVLDLVPPEGRITACRE